MQNTKKLRESTFQAVIKEESFLGMNSIPDTMGVQPGESIFIQNLDIYAGEEGDRLESRRGSQYLRKASGSTKRGSTSIYNKITWDVGAEEYLITQEGTGMYAQALIVTDNPVAIALVSGSAFALGSSAQADLFISGDKLYVFHPAGNFVIRWTGSVFVAYSMGLAYPWIASVTSANTGVITGSYTLGIEKVYIAGGLELMVSTPNRKMPTTRILAVTGDISLKKIKFTIQATELDNDSLWTHLRVWRSKNKNSDVTNPVQPLDPQGNDGELYEEALITKAEIGAGSLTAIATGSTLPPGNIGTTAGKPGSVYTVELNNADAVFFNLVGIDQIELLPIPACTVGCFCANRIFFSGVQDSALDDASKNNIWYSNYAGTKYAFQYNPLNFVDTGRDGQNMIKLIAFEKDVIGIKEAKTGRLPSGNVDLPYQTLDDRIGISHKNFALFVPTIGILAVTSDYGDFRIFGYDLRWTNMLNGRDISIPIRYYASRLVSITTTIAYCNGKVFITDGGYHTYLILYVKEGRGWAIYNYLANGVPLIFTFAQASRIAIVSKLCHLVEMEIAGLNTDIDISDDTAYTIQTILYTRAFRSNNGQDIIEHEYLSMNGIVPTGNIPVTCIVNGQYWQNLTPYYLTPNASVAGAAASLADREYRLYAEPITIGTLKWCPMVGNFISYQLSIPAPCRIRSLALHAIVDQNGMGYGAFDPFNAFPTTNTDPTWAQ